MAYTALSRCRLLKNLHISGLTLATLNRVDERALRWWTKLVELGVEGAR